MLWETSQDWFLNEVPTLIIKFWIIVYCVVELFELMNYEYEDFRNKERTSKMVGLATTILEVLAAHCVFYTWSSICLDTCLHPTGALMQLLAVDYWMYIREQARKIDFDQFK